MEFMPNFKVQKPGTEGEAIGYASKNQDTLYVAGGTDMIVNIRRGIEKPKTLIDLTGVDNLKLIKEYKGEVLRMTLLSAHYRQPLNWTKDIIRQNSTMLDRLYRTLKDLENIDAYAKSNTISSNIIDLDRFHRQLFNNNISPKNISNLHSSYESISNLIRFMLKNPNNTINSLLPDKDDIKKFIEFRNNNYYLKYNILPLIERIDGNYKSINNIAFLLNKIIVDNSNNSTNNSNKSFITVKQYNNDKEYYLECTNARAKILKNNIDIAKDYILTKNSSNTKITNENIKRFSKDIYNDRLNLVSHMQTLFSQKIEEYIRKYTDTCKKISKFIAEIDYFISCANVSSLYNYSCPTIDYDNSDKSKFSATDLRHPLIERINDNEEYIGNDISLGYENDGILLYGTNACGKSSLSKAIGISIIMAQMGMFVPASSFKFTPYKNIYTRILGNDNIFRNESRIRV